MATMRAVTIPTPGGPEVLRVDTVDIPPCPEGHALLKVHAAGVNRADLVQRQGGYAPPPGATQIPGLEASGTIVDIRPGGLEPVVPFAVGDRAAALLTGGGCAEYVPVPLGQLLPVGPELTAVEAAALPEALTTVYSNVFASARLTAGEWLLIHGGASGIGTIAIQMARAHGARVAVTVGSEHKAELCRQLGADAVINHRTEQFELRMQELTQHAEQPDSPSYFGLPRDPVRRPGADVILDIIGADYFERNLEALTREGRLVVIGLQGGAQAKTHLGRMMVRRQTLIATTLRARPLAQKAAIVAGVHRDFWPAVVRGDIRPVIPQVLALDDVVRAHELLEDGALAGKIVLWIGDDD